MSAGSAVVRFFVLVFAVSLMCFPACALDDGVYFGSSIFTPSDSEIVPVDDGTQIIEHTPLWDLYFWKSKIMLFFDSLWKESPYQNFIRTVVLPLASAVLGIILFVVLFSRKNPDHLSPTAAKILVFLEGHPMSAEPAIIRGVGKTCYSTSPILSDAPETAVHFLRNSRQQADIFSYLCKHPWATRKEIADGTSLPVDSVRYHLGNMDARILQKGRREDAETYAIEEWAKEIWEK